MKHNLKKLDVYVGQTAIVLFFVTETINYATEKSQ